MGWYPLFVQIELWVGFSIQKLYSSLETDPERDPKTFNFFQIELWSVSTFFQIELRVGFWIQKLCSSSEIDQERYPKTFNFFQIELWVRYFLVFRSSSELVSKFKNSVLVQKSIKLDLKKSGNRPELYLKKIKSLWIALLIDFWTRTEFLNWETNSELDLNWITNP